MCVRWIFFVLEAIVELRLTLSINKNLIRQKILSISKVFVQTSLRRYQDDTFIKKY